MVSGKKIFISDVHMGSREGLYPKDGHPWGWLGAKRAKYLGQFLMALADDQSVLGVVVLGDLFDDWVVPSTRPPVSGDDDPAALLWEIAKAEQNQFIREGFKAVVRAGKELRYVRGNHDMFLDDSLLQDWVPGFICEPDLHGPGTGAYVIDGLLRAEHGCAYCLTNAPYEQDGEYRYPVGYYLSRINAYDQATNNQTANYLDILSDMARDGGGARALVGNAVLATAKNADLHSSDPFVMNSAYPSGTTVATVADQFRSWFVEWKKRGYGVSPLDALVNETGLQKVMGDKYLRTGEVKIALCGHTHTARIWGKPYDTQLNIDPDRPCDYVYANTGAWVDSVNPTYVEVETSVEDGTAHVRSVRLRKGRTPLVQERFVKMAD
jgi:UDP-2,3-diacylglucosamine pyrophosphatase LpxH